METLIVILTVIHPIIASSLAEIAASAPIYREGFRTKPHEHSATDATKDILLDAYEKRHKELGVEPLPIIRNAGTPMDSKEVPGFDKRRLGMHQLMYQAGPDGKPIGNPVADKFNYNPNADRAILAHEMGHAVSAKTKIGGAIRDLRSNPKLAMAIAAATGVIPLGAAVLTPGDDDYNTAIAGSLALATPILIDEALATKNALAMLNTADMRANLGQRGRLAGGLLSYVAAPAVMASTGTAIGNQFDEDPIAPQQGL